MKTLLLSSFALITIGVWLRQNRGDRLGGKISVIKAGWLAYAIVLWIGVPLYLCTQHQSFLVLLVSMAIRAIAEVPLCLTGRWRVSYGVAHDLAHIALIIGFWSGLGMWAWPTLVSLISELVFVCWFVKATDGPGAGVFFIPGDGAHRWINRATAIVFMPQLIWFVVLLSLS